MGRDSPQPVPHRAGAPGSAAEIRRRLEAAGLRPSHRLGQHFLCDPAAMRDIVAAAGLTPADTVLEIGAGIGTMTSELATRAGRVLALELDRGLCGLLRGAVADLPRVEVICADVMAWDGAELAREGTVPRFKAVANLPFYLTSPLLVKMLTTWTAMDLAVLTVQKEVARRLTAGPGGRDYGATSVLVQYHASAELLRTIPARSFWPEPDVDAAVIKLVRHPQAPVDVTWEQLSRVVRAAFGQRRKQIRNSLSGPPLCLGRERVEALLSKTGLDGTRRAESLSLREFAALARFCAIPSL
jgi:16S rRNA (adenine1518-N6/adenine1519-N6)-dimethyltransferase